MIAGIGTDILLASRVMDLPPEDVFLRKIFTERERAQAAACPEPMRRYASHFSGKEAVFKALNADPNVIRLNDIEILNSETEAPYVTLHGTAARHAAEAGIRTVHISLSWEEDYCLAFAVAET